MTFSATTTNAIGSAGDTLLNNNCAFTATSRNRLAVMSIDGPFSGSPNTVRVRATSPVADNNGLIGVTDTQFDVTARPHAPTSAGACGERGSSASPPSC